MKTKSRLILAALVLVSGAAVLGNTCARDDSWQFTHGVLIASGSQLHRAKNPESALLSLNGSRRISADKLEDASIYHAIIFSPDIVSGGASTFNVGPTSIEAPIWMRKQGEPEGTEFKPLEIKHHALERTFTVGSESFALSKGNLFIIRLNESWVPATRQVPAQLNEKVGAQKVLDSFKAALPEDKIIQGLELY